MTIDALIDDIIDLLKIELFKGGGGVSLTGFAIGGSVLKELRDDVEQDIDIVAVASLAHRQRLRLPFRGRTLDVFQETEQSIQAEFVFPRRGAVIYLIGMSRIFLDTNGFLARSKLKAQELTKLPAPPSIFQVGFAVLEESRDLFLEYKRAETMLKATVRGLLLGRLVNLAFAKTSCWPVRLTSAISALTAVDWMVADLASNAIAGDDVALDELVNLLIPTDSAPRRGPPSKLFE